MASRATGAGMLSARDHSQGQCSRGQLEEFTAIQRVIGRGSCRTATRVAEECEADAGADNHGDGVDRVRTRSGHHGDQSDQPQRGEDRDTRAAPSPLRDADEQSQYHEPHGHHHKQENLVTGAEHGDHDVLDGRGDRIHHDSAHRGQWGPQGSGHPREEFGDPHGQRGRCHAQQLPGTGEAAVREWSGCVGRIGAARG